MTFDEILDQVIALLKRQGRVSYSALKIRFNLNDDYLEAFKTELIEAQHLAIDENGRVLVWIGDPHGTPGSASQFGRVTQRPTVQPDQPRRDRAASSVLPPLDAERRQLTVMFCDLVDSTLLAEQLDPEDLREVVRAYQQTCAEVIQHFDGYVAQYLGDGLLVYFGFPSAHEDDPQRAVRAGLGILEAMQHLNRRLEQDKGVRLAVRLGMHTGRVVVGEMGAEGRHEHLALGDTPNIASRLQDLAIPNTVNISAATFHLVEGYFTCQDLGSYALKGIETPLRVYRVLSESGIQSRLDVLTIRGLTPLVGREQEVGVLVERWEQVKHGQGQVVILSGEAGIGKSRLVQVLKEHLADEPHTRLECRSSPYYQNTALYPIVDLWQRICAFTRDDSPDARLEKLERTLRQYRIPLEESVPLFASLLSLPLAGDRYPPLALSPQRQRQKLLETILTMLRELAEPKPLLFILEDLHWIDPTSLALLDLCIDQAPTAPILTLLTCRPTFHPPWSRRAHLTQIRLNRLPRHCIEQMAPRVAGGRTLPAEVLQHIVEKTDGIPLFVEEITKALLESGHLQETHEHYELTGPLSAVAIPSTLHDSLMARLDRLVTAKAVAQYAAGIGRHFSYALLQAVSQLDEATLQHELDRLVEAELIYQQGVPPQASYMFKHALIQEAAYQSLLKRTQQQYQLRIAQVLAERFPETAETQPELLAHHYTEAGLGEQAVGYWQRAGQRALERSAYVEGISHLGMGLHLLKALPETTERIAQERTMQLALGRALLATKGYAAPEVGAAYTRARELCQQGVQSPQLFPVLFGLWQFYVLRGDLQVARELGEQLLALAQYFQDPAYLLEAHRSLAFTCFSLGEMAPARAHAERGIGLYHPQQHHAPAFMYGQDSGTSCLAYASLALWHLGYPDQALQRSHQMLRLAHELSHPFSLAHALYFASLLHQHRREVQEARECADALIALSIEHGFELYVIRGTLQRSWALTEQGQLEVGMTQMRRGLNAYRDTGAELVRPYFLAWLAEACWKVGQLKEGLHVLGEALALVEQHQECWWEAELYRLKGALLLKQSVPDAKQAEACLQQALDIARSQQVKSLELRAVMSLSRLWQQQDKCEQAAQLLAPIYGWFTEGFDTADLQEAKALLDALTCPP